MVDGQGCVDVDECSDDGLRPVCTESQYCLNTNGSASCADCDKVCLCASMVLLMIASVVSAMHHRHAVEDARVVGRASAMHVHLGTPSTQQQGRAKVCSHLPPLPHPLTH